MGKTLRQQEKLVQFLFGKLQPVNLTNSTPQLVSMTCGFHQAID